MKQRDGSVMLLVLALVTLIVLIGSMLIRGYLIQDTQSTVNSISENTPTNDIEVSINYSKDFDWKTPVVSKDFNWSISQIPTDSDIGLDYRIFLDSRYSDEDQSRFKDVILGGTLYEVKLSESDTQYQNLERYIHDQISSEIFDLGWGYSANYGDWHIQGMAADGVFSSSIGFVKLNGKDIRTVVLTHEKIVESWDGPGSEIMCPCWLKAKVFVSDIGEINKFIY